MDRSFFRFVIIHAFDRRTDRQMNVQTEFSSLDRVCIPCSAVKINKQLSYRREIALHGVLVIAKSVRLEQGYNIYGHYRSIFNHCDVFGEQSNQIR